MRRIALQKCRVHSPNSLSHARPQHLKVIQLTHHNNRTFPHRTAHTLSTYALDPLDAPLHSAPKSALPVSTSSSASPTLPLDGIFLDTARTRNTTLDRARAVFGSKQQDAADRRAERAARSTIIAGVVVPEKPEEPDNCCMSGCVNCVWDGYRDEMEEWAARMAEARVAEARMKGGVGLDLGGGSKVEDGMGGDDAELFGEIPVGIREFMKMEKKLKGRQVEGSALVP